VVNILRPRRGVSLLLICCAGTVRVRENPFNCHPEEPLATKDLCSSLKLQLPGFFAPLRMTGGGQELFPQLLEACPSDSQYKSRRFGHASAAPSGAP